MRQICEAGLHENEVICIFFDGRKDETKVNLTTEGSEKLYPSTVKEEHCSVCVEPGGEYVHHFTPSADESKGASPAEQIAGNLVEWMQTHGLDKSLIAIGGDSTNLNTGWKGGVMQFVEKTLGRRFNWLVCMLHTNELPLRHLIENLDGKTGTSNSFTGPLGKALSSVTDLPINSKFAPITVGSDFIELLEAVLNDLSRDQKYGYKMVQAIRKGHVPADLALVEIGPVNHSRWLTTANRFLRLYVSQHQFKGRDEKI